MKKIILPLLAVIALNGCSFYIDKNVDLASQCLQLYKSRLETNPDRYDESSYELLNIYQVDSQVWYDNKYDGCVFAVIANGSYKQLTPNEETIYYMNKNYWDLETDSKIWSFTNEFNKNLVDTENNFFSDNKF